MSKRIEIIKDIIQIITNMINEGKLAFNELEQNSYIVNCVVDATIETVCGSLTASPYTQEEIDTINQITMLVLPSYQGLSGFDFLAVSALCMNFGEEGPDVFSAFNTGYIYNIELRKLKQYAANLYSMIEHTQPTKSTHASILLDRFSKVHIIYLELMQNKLDFEVVDRRINDITEDIDLIYDQFSKPHEKDLSAVIIVLASSINFDKLTPDIKRQIRVIFEKYIGDFTTFLEKLKTLQIEFANLTQYVSSQGKFEIEALNNKQAVSVITPTQSINDAPKPRCVIC